MRPHDLRAERVRALARASARQFSGVVDESFVETQWLRLTRCVLTEAFAHEAAGDLLRRQLDDSVAVTWALPSSCRAAEQASKLPAIPTEVAAEGARAHSR